MSIKIRYMLGVLIVALAGIAGSASQAAPILYSVMLNATLNNAGGTWGGNLNTGAGQHINLTVNFFYDDTPTNQTANSADFVLTALQIIDNDNGLASALIPPVDSSLTIRYAGANDMIAGAVTASPAGGAFMFMAMGEFGDVGDPMPVGAAFDAMVSSTIFSTLIARATDINDNVNGRNGSPAPGAVFTSQRIPEPGTVAIFVLGLAGLGLARRKIAA